MRETFKKIITVLIVSLMILLLAGLVQASDLPIPVSPPESRYTQESKLTDVIRQPDKTGISGYGFALGLTAFFVIYILNKKK